MSECQGCGHARSKHYKDIDGVARCVVVESGTSTSGVIGLPWSRDCDCADGVSVREERRKAKADAEEKRFRERIEAAMVDDEEAQR